jgi:N-terminal half of MaoC dehydratase
MADPDSSLAAAYTAAREHIGGTQRIQLGVMRPLDFQRFAIAVGVAEGPSFDRDEALAAGHPDVVAPPLYLSAVLGWGAGPKEPDLQPDGSATESLGAVSFEGLRLMGGGQELTFHEPVVAGMDVYVDVTVDDVQLKAASSGDLILLTILRKYFADDDQPLLDSRETFIAR